MDQYRCPECEDPDETYALAGLRPHLHHEHGIGDGLGDSDALDPVVERAEPVDADPDPDEEGEHVEEPDSGEIDTEPDPDPESADSDPDPEPDATTEQDEDTQDMSQTPETSGDESDPEHVEVGHDGGEKLSPDNAPDDAGKSIEAPPGVSDEAPPDAFEPDAPDSSDAAATEESNPPAGSDQSIADMAEEGVDADPDEVIENSANPERTAEAKAQLDDAFEEPEADPDAQTESTSGGVRVDEDMVSSVIGMPGNMAASYTGWEGWELSDQERKDNARLFIAMCEERNVDPSPTVIFLFSMMGTYGGRFLAYRAQRDPEPDDEEHVEEPTEEKIDTEPDAEPDDEEIDTEPEDTVNDPEERNHIPRTEEL